jgi:flagellar L-ring protein precursor FlgH
VNKVSQLLLASFLLAFPSYSHEWRLSKKPNTPQTSTVYDDYLARVRAMNPELPATLGSLWVDSGRLSQLASDYKARNPGDLLTINLVDSFTAATSGENNQSRAFAANSNVTSLFGTLAANNRMQNLLGATSGHTLDGKGASTMSSSVQLSLAAQVMERLPNGTLVIQAARDITLGNDRQTVFIRGLVRPGDILPNNSILSTSISDIQVEIKGKGAVADASRQPNIIVRTLLKFLDF